MSKVRTYILIGWGILALSSAGEVGAVARPSDLKAVVAEDPRQAADTAALGTNGEVLLAGPDTLGTVMAASDTLVKNEDLEYRFEDADSVVLDREKRKRNVSADSSRRRNRSALVPLDRPMPSLDSLPQLSLAGDSLSMGASADSLQNALPQDSLSMKQDSMAKAPQRARFLPTRRRMDREINQNRFIFKREVAVGLTVSYGMISSDDTDFMLVLDNMDFSGSVFSINPSVGYFIKDNLSVGLRFGYSKTKGDVNSLGVNLGSSNDIDISLSDLHLTNNAASAGIFMRSYAGIDAKGHFGLFAELELSYKNGDMVFSYKSNEEVKYTRSNTQQYKFSFNPGCAVFIFPNVCSTLSFGLGGLQYTKIKQTDNEGNVIGQRDAAKMRFRLNLLNIRIGLNILL